MTREEAKVVFLNRGYVKMNGGEIFNGDKWRQSVVVISEWLKEQEPKTGHWISHREHCEQLGVMPSGLGDYEWCSNCDCGIDVVEWHRNHYNFCPSCGIKMVKHYMPIQSLYVDINDIIDES